MPKYTFSGPKGVKTTVQASNEYEARHLAMVERWGPPYVIGKWPQTDKNGKYYSTGLHLDLVEEDADQ